MHIKIFHEDAKKIDSVYQKWVSNFKGGKVDVIAYTASNAYGNTTLTVHYKVDKSKSSEEE